MITRPPTGRGHLQLHRHVPGSAALLVPDDVTQPRILAVPSDVAPLTPGRFTVVVSTRVSRVRADGPDAPNAATEDRHIRASDGSSPAWRVAADVLTTFARAGGTELTARVEGLAHHHPGALVVMAHSSAQGRVLIRTCRPPHGQLVAMHRLAADEGAWPVWASLVHAWLIGGVPAEVLVSTTIHTFERSAMTDGGATRWKQAVRLTAVH